MTHQYEPGDPIWHDSGQFLGHVTEHARGSVVVRFKGDRTRDGLPVTMATVYETRPTADEGSDQ